MSKTLVLGSNGLIGKAICEKLFLDGRELLTADLEPPADYTGQLFSECFPEFVDFMSGYDIEAIVDATYPTEETYPFWMAYYYEAMAIKLRENRNTSMVLISSIFGVIASDYRVYSGTIVKETPLWYSFIKGGIISITRQLASIYAPFVRVNCISPGGVHDKQDPLFVMNYCDQTPMDRMATPYDIAGVVAFLISPAASYITGQNIIVDGGRTIW